MYNDEILIQGLEELGLAPDEEKLTLLHRYYERMIATNEVMNLTAITEYEDVCVKHFLDSLCLVKAIPSDQLEAGMTIIDIGTGAGFPGIPIAIMMIGIAILNIVSITPTNDNISCALLQKVVNPVI